MARRTQRPIEQALTRAARDDCPRILSVLAAKFGDLDLADEAVQEALIDAHRRWPEAGVPDNPGGWLMTAARRRALDRLRNEQRHRQRLLNAAAEIDERSLPADAGGSTMYIDNTRASDEQDPTGGDERLRLLLLCCHPALDQETQIALTLRLVGGLTTPEISAAFLTPEPTLAQRIVRAKKKIRAANIPMDLPDNLDERLATVLAVLYLIFNEGYLSSGEYAEMIRVDLIDEAVRLTRLVSELAPESPEAAGLLALELFHRARSRSRLDATGDLVLLEDQDRSQWDGDTIREANRHLADAMARTQPGPYQLQALIAAQHANAVTAGDTDWSLIAQLYGQLEAMAPTPVVSLNRAVAIGMADGPLAGLAVLDQIDILDDYHLYWATKGELHLRSDNPTEALPAFERARELTDSPVEQRHLDARIERCRAA